ncbi:MAG: hypothetical protein A2Y65_04590 [Deltaproteobacteria bacterium RBG_13_52_11]|nr:MAG: hypothetical protein A2Y65_04590 [Deltaproteobacteria bacterium RBG_13_52_11]
MGKKDNNGLSRRDFIKLAAGGAAALTAWGSGCFTGAQGPRAGIPNPFVQGGQPLVVSVQGKDPERMLRAALEALGSLKPLVGNGNETLIKPNFIFPQPFPITADPEMIFLVARLLREAGSRGVEVFDAPGTYLVGTERQTSSFNDIVRRGHEQGIAVTIGDAGRRREYVKTKKAGWRAYPEIIVHKKIHQAPVVVNMPCLKRHHSSFLTCALKNQFGAIYGAQRWDSHIRGEGIQKGMKGATERTKAAFRDETHFMTALAEFADAVRPELSIVDARAILIKGGPTRGKGEIKEGVNRIILSGDMVALDAYCSRLMEKYDETYTTEMIRPYLRVAERLGLGTMDLKKAKIIEITV